MAEERQPERVFISGSRSIKSLPQNVVAFLNRCIDKGDIILVGDCPLGADALVQKYLADKEYQNVKVYFSNEPRYFRGEALDWDANRVEVPKGLTGRELFTVKDVAMTNDCDKGLVIWDGKSKGTKSNIDRLKAQGKECAVCVFTWTMDIER